MYNQDDKEKVLELHQEGYSIRNISSMINIPKSTVADWLKERDSSPDTDTDDLNPEESDNLTGQPEKSMVLEHDPDIFRANFHENTGQNEQLFPGDVSKPDKIPLIRTDNSALPGSAEWIELKKKEIEQLHRREMRKMDQLDEDRHLREREVSVKEQIHKETQDKKKADQMHLLHRIQSVANYLLSEIDGQEIEFSDAEDLYDNIMEILNDLETLCIFHNINCRKMKSTKFLVWIKCECQFWLDDFEPDESFEVEFSEKEASRIQRIIDLESLQ